MGKTIVTRSTQGDGGAERFAPVVAAVPHMIYGGDYNPEQWPEEVWAEDARLMREAGVNLVSLGIFAWARIESRPDAYDFAWLDRVMDLLHAHGVAVNLATATASPPPWLARLHPESLPVTAEGVRLWPGSRQHYCPSSAAYRERAAMLVERIAVRYAGHPALALWHINNEYGCHVSECFCDACAEHFRAWLLRRYGDLAALNSAWGTAFWSQQYAEWAEIHPPRQAPTFINPSQLLDWRRFCSDNLLELFELERAALRRHTPAIPVTTNFMGFFKPLDYWKWARHEDIVSHDCYPDPTDPTAHIGAAMSYDLMRSLGGGRPWLLMEQTSSIVNWRECNATKPPGLMRLWSYQAVARGADGVMFFQWRASTAGAEQFHGAMLPHAGTDSRVWREVAALGAELQCLDAVVGGRVQAEVAILLDWESWWALESPGKPSSALRQLDQLSAMYAALFAQGLTADFAHPEDDLSHYRLVVAPSLFLLGEHAASGLSRFVAAGGSLLVTCQSGIVDSHGHVLQGGYPALLREVLGVRVEEFAPLAADKVGLVYTADEQELAYRTWAEVIHAEGAEVLAYFGGGFPKDQPAVTRHAHGAGSSYYVGTCLEPAGLSWVLARACADAGVAPPLITPVGVEVVRRVHSKDAQLFVLNHGLNTATVTLPAPMRDILSGAAGPSLTLAPRGVAILQDLD